MLIQKITSYFKNYSPDEIIKSLSSKESLDQASEYIYQIHHSSYQDSIENIRLLLRHQDQSQGIILHSTEKLDLIYKEKVISQRKFRPKEDQILLLNYIDYVHLLAIDYFKKEIQNAPSLDKKETSLIEDKNYQWLKLTIKFLKDTLEKVSSSNEDLFQAVVFIKKEEKLFRLQMRILSLDFTFLSYGGRKVLIQVFDMKKDQEAELKLNAEFIDLAPQSIDLLIELFTSLRQSIKKEVC